MTANQINAYEAREIARHNEVVENETTRHNLAVEEIEQYNNSLKAQSNEITAKYNDEMVRINDDKNRITKLAADADREELVRYHDMLQDLEQQKVDLDIWYKEQQVTLNEMQQTIDRKAKEEVERSNRANEWLKQQSLDYQNKSLEFQRYSFDQSYILDQQELMYKESLALLQNEQKRAERILTEREIARKERETFIAEQLLPYQQNLMRAQEIGQYANSVTGVMRSVPPLITMP